MRVAVLRCARLPRFVTWEIPNVDDLFNDDRLLIAELVDRGVDAESVAWNDNAVDWSVFDVALLRSTWDYIDDRTGFISALAGIEASGCRLLNPLATVRWNSDKRYLLDLAARRVPVVPSFGLADADAGQLQRDFLDHDWSAAVVKPMVGAGAAGVRRIATADLARTIGELAGITLEPSDGSAAASWPPGGPSAAGEPFEGFAAAGWLVQPFADAVATEGEWSFVYLGGRLSHVLLKRPAPGDFRAHGIYGGTVVRQDPDAGDVREADAILAALPDDLLYARLDLVRRDGRLEVVELELIEPILYLDRALGAAARLADATIAAARG